MKQGIHVGNLVELYDRSDDSSLFLATRERDGKIYLQGLNAMDADTSVRIDKLEQNQMRAGRVYDVPYETKALAAKLLEKDLNVGERSALYNALDREVSFTKPAFNFSDEKAHAQSKSESEEDINRRRYEAALERLPNFSQNPSAEESFDFMK